MKLQFTIDLDELEAPSSVIEGIRSFIKVLLNVTPDYYNVGSSLQKQFDVQLNEQDTPDPRNVIQEKWCDIFDALSPQTQYTAWDMQERHGDAEQDGDMFRAWDNFFNSVGEAMGPVCFAGYELKKELKKRNFPTDWIDDCIKFYQENWSWE